MSAQISHLSEEDLFAYLHDISSSLEPVQVRSHLSQCLQCRQALEREKKLELALTSPALKRPVRAPADLAFRVLEEIEPLSSPRSVRNSRAGRLSSQSWYWLFVSLALAVTLLLNPPGSSGVDAPLGAYLSDALGLLRSDSARLLMTILIVAYALWAIDKLLGRWMRTSAT